MLPTITKTACVKTLEVMKTRSAEDLMVLLDKMPTELLAFLSVSRLTKGITFFEGIIFALTLVRFSLEEKEIAELEKMVKGE